MTQDTNTPAPGTPEYNEAMAAKYDGQSQPPVADPTAQNFVPQKAEKPQWVPEKFWDAEKGEVRTEDLAKSYRELESSRGKPNAETPPTDAEASGEAESAVAAAGLDWDSLSAKVFDRGELDPSDYTALEKSGIPREIVDNYIEVAKLGKEAAVSRTAEYVGGKDVLDAIIEGATNGLSEDERAFYNEQLAHPTLWKSAMDTLKTRFAAGDGEPSGQVHGTGVAATSGGTYASQEEYLADMRRKNDQGHKLYEVDPAYRDRVRMKYAMSNV